MTLVSVLLISYSRWKFFSIFGENVNYNFVQIWDFHPELVLDTLLYQMDKNCTPVTPVTEKAPAAVLYQNLIQQMKYLFSYSYLQFVLQNIIFLYKNVLNKTKINNKLHQKTTRKNVNVKVNMNDLLCLSQSTLANTTFPFSGNSFSAFSAASSQIGLNMLLNRHQSA